MFTRLEIEMNFHRNEVRNVSFFQRQVNVKPSERPQDLYGEVANLVEKKRAADAAAGDKLAMQLEGTLF